LLRLYLQAFRVTPKKTPCIGIELVNHGQILVTFEYGNIINADLGDTVKDSVCQTIFDNVFDQEK
jgi:hypothetical protein